MYQNLCSVFCHNRICMFCFRNYCNLTRCRSNHQSIVRNNCYPFPHYFLREHIIRHFLQRNCRSCLGCIQASFFRFLHLPFRGVIYIILLCRIRIFCRQNIFCHTFLELISYLRHFKSYNYLYCCAVFAKAMCAYLLEFYFRAYTRSVFHIDPESCCTVCNIDNIILSA